MPDFEAQIFARDIASVLEDAGWQARFVDASESQMPEMNFATGVMIFTLLDGKTTTEAGTALWTAMVNAEHEMGGEPFENAPVHEILDKPRVGYSNFDPPITAVFVRVGIRQVTRQFLEIQRRRLEQQSHESEALMRQVWDSGGE